MEDICRLLGCRYCAEDAAARNAVANPTPKETPVSETYPAGTVARICVREGPTTSWLIAERDTGAWQAGTARYKDATVTDIRPLVVLDLDIDIRLLRSAFDRWLSWTSLLPERSEVANLIAAIEAQLPKPKPAEPLGLGAVVEEDEGQRWVCAYSVLRCRCAH